MIDKIDETSGMVELWFSISQMLIREKEKNNVRINVSQTLIREKEEDNCMWINNWGNKWSNVIMTWQVM